MFQMLQGVLREREHLIRDVRGRFPSLLRGVVQHQAQCGQQRGEDDEQQARAQAGQESRHEREVRYGGVARSSVK